jgi:hypothetical protein
MEAKKDISSRKKKTNSALYLPIYCYNGVILSLCGNGPLCPYLRYMRDYEASVE